MNEKYINIRFSRFLEYTLGPLDRSPIYKDDGFLIATDTDKNENIVHVQFEDLTTGKELDRPILWVKKEWVKEYSEHLRRKDTSRKQRIAVDKIHSNIEIVASIFSKKWKMPKEKVIPLAKEIILHAGSIDLEFLKRQGIEMSSLTDEEKSILGKSFTIL